MVSKMDIKFIQFIVTENFIPTLVSREFECLAVVYRKA